MKKYIIMLLIVSAMFTGCGKDEEKTESQIITENTEETLANDNVQNTPFVVTVAGDEKRIILVQSEDYDFYLKMSVEPVYGTVSYYYEVEQKNKKDISQVRIENLRINDKNVSEVELVDFEELNSGVLTAKATKIMSYLQINGNIELNNIMGEAVMIYSDGKEAASKDEFIADVPGKKELGFGIYPFRDALCLEQTLQSDDRIDIKLKGLGKFDNSDEAEILRGILEITNKTQEEIPYAIQEIVINGCCFSVDGSAVISPGKTYFSEFAIRSDKLDEMGVNSIATISIYLLTSYDENTSISGEDMKGGDNYELLLEQKGQGSTWSPPGEPVYNENDLEVYVTDVEINDGDVGWGIFFAPSVTYSLIVDNNTDKDISFDYSDTKFDGKPCAKGGAIIKHTDGSYENWSILSNVIPSGSRKNVDITFRSWDMIFPCSVSCRFDFTSAGGGQILYRSDEIVLNAEEIK